MKKKFILPIVIRIEPSGLCNFRCQHCTVGIGLNKSAGIMSRQIFDLVFSKINIYRFKSAVLYHGGEPLISKDLFYMIDKVATISEFVKLNTNGSLMTDEIIEKILLSPLSRIEFSLDGSSVVENNNIRRGSDFLQISNQIIKLLKRKKECGSKVEVVIHNIQVPSRNTDLKVIYSPNNILEKFADWTDEIEIKSYYSYMWPEYPGRNKTKSKLIANFCDHIISTLTIRWNGDVVPCCYDLTSQSVMGNILESSLEKIWTNSKYNDLRSKIENRTPPKLCQNCFQIYEKQYLYKDQVNI
ncbi:SPASM domain-containing protein [Candidatus Shapirobacteria bacterium]|nr:SPASM domain-containing protein [Candidatus Shapirobacteria bacterium]